ncbi:MAG: S41 family peptidase [Acidobacteriota bacterium]|nr:S41 family peptidase [Acidobacteriota bacterium]
MPVTRAELFADARRLDEGVVVNSPGWEQALENNKVSYFDQFANSPRFAAAYPPTLSNGQFVDALNANAGGARSSNERDALVAALDSSTKTRAQALRAVVEDSDFAAGESNRAFVLMQYFGYLRRDPDAAGFDSQPDPTFNGYNFWLSKLEQFGGNFVAAEMVKAFVSSIEYRARFALPTPLGADKWRQDLQFLATQLPLLHVNAFTKITRDEFDRAVADLNRDIPTLQDRQIIVRLTQIVAMIGDAHTSLRADGTPQQFRVYPLTLYWLKDGLYATAAAAPYKKALGARLVRVGDTDVQQAYQTVSTLISHENEPTLKYFSPSRMVSTEALQALGILPDLKTGHFVFQDSGGNEFALDFAPVNTSRESIDFVSAPDPAQWPSYQKHPELNYWFEHLDDSKTLYFKYNLCADMTSPTFNQFFQTMFDYCATHECVRAVIDVRNNPGGSSALLQPVIDALKNSPDINQRGRLFVVIGRGTFSSAMLNAITLRQQTNATLVGEPTGGKPNAFGEVKTFRLPNSGLSVSYSTKFFSTVAGDPPSLDPEVFVELTAADYFAGRDPVIGAILNL